MSIQAASSFYLGLDEIKVLGWLTLLQRCKQPVEIGVAEELRASLMTCSKGHDSGFRLGYRNVQRCLMLELNAISQHGQFGAASLVPACYLSGSTLQARALQFVRERGVVPARELNRFGVSRQLISMFKRGLLKRTAFGKYAATAESVLGVS